MFDSPQISILIDLNTLYACKPHEWLEFTRVGRCYVPQAVYEELDAWASNRSQSSESRIAREFRRFMLESDWQVTRSPLLVETIQPFSRRARLAIQVRNSAEELARSSLDHLIVVVSNDRALIQQVQALNVENLTGIPVSTLLSWSRSKRQPPVVLQRLRAMQTQALQVIRVGRSRAQTSAIAVPKSPSAPVYRKSWRDRLLPTLIVVGGLALGWNLAHSLITLIPPQTYDQR